MSRISIPLGKVADDDIECGIRTISDDVADELQRLLGPECRIEREELLVQNEVAADNRTVYLKAVQKQLTVRIGTFDGVNIEFAWLRRRKEEMSITISTKSLFLEWCFRAVFVISGAVAVVCSIQLRDLRKAIVFFIFGVAFVALMIRKRSVPHQSSRK